MKHDGKEMSVCAVFLVEQLKLLVREQLLQREEFVPEMFLLPGCSGRMGGL